MAQSIDCELQTAPSDAVGNDIASKSITTVVVEAETAKLLDPIYRMAALFTF